MIAMWGLVGLSPRLRGNPLETDLEAPIRGSIPAPAGEPFGVIFVSGIIGVYPRACGGTDDNDSAIIRYEGLSPRLRGNPYALS